MHLDALILSRITVNGTLYVASYQRNLSGPNSFVKFVSDGGEEFGQVQSFMVNDLMGEAFAQISLYREIECSDLPQIFCRKIVRTDTEDMVAVHKLKKMFHMRIEDDDYTLELDKCFVHNFIPC